MPYNKGLECKLRRKIFHLPVGPAQSLASTGLSVMKNFLRKYKPSNLNNHQHDELQAVYFLTIMFV